MGYKELCNKWFPHLEVVCDFTKGKYADISLEERAMMSQQELQALLAAEQEEFAKSRDNTCFGGSDIGTIFGKGYDTPSVLALKKQGVKFPRSKESEDILRTGHLAEPLIRQAFERASGIRVYEWPLTMVNPKYPKFRMNVDGILCFDNGSFGVYEGKWTKSWMVRKDHYEAMKNYRSKGIEPPLSTCPEGYLFQVWGYEAGLEVDLGYLCGGWGFSDEEIGYVRIPRLSSADEAYMMQVCEEFMDIVNKGGLPSDDVFQNKDRQMEAYETLSKIMPYNAGDAWALPSSEAAAAKKLLDLEQEVSNLKQQLKDEISEVEEAFRTANPQLEEKEQEIKALTAHFAEKLLENAVAYAEDENGRYELTYLDQTGRHSWDKELCKEKYPEVFREIYRPQVKRKLTVTAAGKEDHHANHGTV